MNQTHFIGLDIGTTGARVSIFSTLGVVKGSGSRTYPFIVSQPGWAEQEPQVIFSAVVAAVRDAVNHACISPAAIAAVGFSSVFHSLIAIDATGRALTNSLTWADNRSADQAARLRNSPEGQALYRRTGTPIHPSSPLTKLIWLREEDPETFRQAARFISIKEYVLYQLFARYLVDYSVASATGLLNLESLTWDEEALALAGIRPNQLSELVPPTYILQGMEPGYAEALGLAPNTPVVIGAGDGVLANLGVGAVRPGQFVVTIGSSSGVRSVAPRPKTDPKGRTFCYALTEHHWIVGSPSNTGGMVLRWLHDELGYSAQDDTKAQKPDSYHSLIQAAAKIPAGAEGLIFLPFLSGARAPYWDTDARGVFFGMALHHRQAHFIRATLEGILFSVYSIHMALYELIGPAQEARATGGLTRSPEVQQMMADIFGYDLLVPEVAEASSFGAALMAMYALGLLADLAESQRLVQITARCQPNPQLTGWYRELFTLYESIYYSLRHEFAALARLRQTQPIA